MVAAQNTSALSASLTDEPAALPVLPDPAVQPTMTVWPETARALGLSRQATYDAVATGEIPSVRIGTRILVLTAPLRRMLGFDPDPGTREAA